jgi:DNA-binding MarR family transcriptional regulator
MDPAAPDPDARLRALGDELMRVGRRRTSGYPGSRLEVSAYRLLWVITEGPATLRELAERLQLDQSTVNRQVNAAIQQGLVERYAVPGSPSRRLRPSEAGWAAYRHDSQVRTAVLAGALDDLGPERAAALVDLLRGFNDAWDERIAATARPQ